MVADGDSLSSTYTCDMGGDETEGTQVGTVSEACDTEITPVPLVAFASSVARISSVDKLTIAVRNMQTKTGTLNKSIIWNNFLHFLHIL